MMDLMEIKKQFWDLDFSKINTEDKNSRWLYHHGWRLINLASMIKYYIHSPDENGLIALKKCLEDLYNVQPPSNYDFIGEQTLFPGFYQAARDMERDLAMYEDVEKDLESKNQ